MYNETSYEEYMRNVLEYRPTCCEQDLYANNNCYITPMDSNMVMEDNSCDELYPEIYHKIYPVICNECKNVTMPVNNETLERMTDNVIKSIEIDLKIETKNVRQEDRQMSRRDNFLRDLIRILILRELFGGRFPGRPRPPRPPFPGGPGMGPRPPFPGVPGPIRPREF
ncbi:MAG: hypothetical protein J6A04_03860 [Clostridia bacterium]|nr:hypothetical protein [Clostridia bacterium]